jgi:hypothetical protein
MSPRISAMLGLPALVAAFLISFAAGSGASAAPLPQTCEKKLDACIGSGIAAYNRCLQTMPKATCQQIFNGDYAVCIHNYNVCKLSGSF